MPVFSKNNESLFLNCTKNVLRKNFWQKDNITKISWPGLLINSTEENENLIETCFYWLRIFSKLELPGNHSSAR